MRRLLVVAGCLLLGSRLAQAQTIEYYHLDGTGNVLAVTASAGAVVEQHDYLPFGEELCGTGICAAVTAGQPKRFTGKERDAETGLDYFGARYYGSRIARFTTVDPVVDIKAALVDPQRWNKYAYGRNNPLRYVDPTGAVLELLGNDKGAALDRVKGMAGADAGNLLYTRESEGRTFVGYRGSASDFRAAGGEIGWYLQTIIDQPDRTIQFAVSSSFTDKGSQHTTANFGGAATVGSEESLTGHTQIFTDPNAGSMADARLGSTILGAWKSSDGRPLRYTNSIVDVHEFGHAWANAMWGLRIHNSNATNPLALRLENSARAREGMTNMRIIH
jgi:RHS repeat-associated protein